ncbi:5'-methylthioadenosine phosphorylase [Actinopolyspora lacussalsi subsp. righensis]|uniref:S-methyl-5'-thioadenosine phosphorylase n=1 Tax=Actinopolyspora righensis TaxID=995060 RepID=A0A1I7C2Z8_9ACTN|nr:S-methyl-5'-thioadenosine phosphorylase [Actinopolyspora righensis]SFT93781.1 5'-methylthioadenosine phosphorylase [Actinopolyspora righensis]
MSSTPKSEEIQIGIIGGSGLYDFEALTDVRRVHTSTPYGDPSDSLVIGSLEGVRVAFIPRHGRNHQITPTNIPSRANIYALKSLGARAVVGVSAVGSLREDFAPGDLVIPDQIVDRSRGHRADTFFEGNTVVHVPFGEPFCGTIRPSLIEAARSRISANVHKTGTYCCIEGPQFSTRAESELYRAWGMDVIGMTALPEAKLAREAELCYTGIALVTDYDCWRAGHEDVSADEVAEVMKSNTAAAKETLLGLLKDFDVDTRCSCQYSLSTSIITPIDTLRSSVSRHDDWLVRKYVP